MASQRWQDLDTAQRTALLVVASTEVALTATAVVDLARRSKERVRGRRWMWWPVLFVQPVGPLLYLFWGRRRPS